MKWLWITLKFPGNSPATPGVERRDQEKGPWRGGRVSERGTGLMALAQLRQLDASP